MAAHVACYHPSQVNKFGATVGANAPPLKKPAVPVTAGSNVSALVKMFSPKKPEPPVMCDWGEACIVARVSGSHIFGVMC